MLNADELGFFARNGFLRVPGVASEADCQVLIEETWKLLPAHWRRDEPAGWTGSVQDSCHTAPVDFRRGHLKFQKGSFPVLDVHHACFATDSPLGQAAQALLGVPLAPVRHRGLYCVVPTEFGEPASRPAHHIESHPAHLIALTYLADVAQGGGGLLVWPGSHRELYRTMGSKLEHVSTPASIEAYSRWTRYEPFEVFGRRGDSVLIHHRLLHAPSVNRSSRMRYAFLCDYMRHDFKLQCAQAPGDDLWADWPALRGLAGQRVDEGSDIRLAQARPVDADAAGAASAGLRPALDVSVRLKTEASRLARLRQPGDLWLVITDDEAASRNASVLPAGWSGAGQGLKLLVDGERVHSLTKAEWITRLQAAGPSVRIQVSPAPRPLWMKLVRVALPFEASVLLHRAALPVGRPLQVHVPLAPEASAAA